MLKVGLIGVGLVSVLGVIGASMTMNFLFGYGFGTTLITARVWGGLSVAADGLKAVLPVLIAYQWAARHWGRVAVGAGIFPIVLLYGLMSALGFSGQSRAAFVGERDNLRAAYIETEADLAQAERRLAELGRFRLAGVVEAELSSARRDGLWDSSKGCRETTAPALRGFCRRFDALRAELVVIGEATGLRGKIESLKERRRQARERGGLLVADTQADVLHHTFGVDAGAARAGLNWLPAVLVEVVSAFGLLVVDQARVAVQVQQKAKPQEPPWRLVGDDDADGEGSSNG